MGIEVKELIAFIKVFYWCNNPGLDLDDGTKDIGEWTELRVTHDLEFKMVDCWLGLGEGDI